MGARRVWGQDEKLKIVLEGLRSANVAETCRKYELKLALFHTWKSQMLEGARAGLGDKRHRGYRDPLTEEVHPVMSFLVCDQPDGNCRPDRLNDWHQLGEAPP